MTFTAMLDATCWIFAINFNLFSTNIKTMKLTLSSRLRYILLLDLDSKYLYLFFFSYVMQKYSRYTWKHENVTNTAFVLSFHVKSNSKIFE